MAGIRLYFDVARRFPLLAHFLARVGPRAAGPSNLLYTYLPVHLAEGMKRGEFVAMPMLTALDIIVGTGILVVARISAGEADDKYLRASLGLMRSLGYPSERSEALLSLEFGEESLLVRTHKAHEELRPCGPSRLARSNGCRFIQRKCLQHLAASFRPPANARSPASGAARRR